MSKSLVVWTITFFAISILCLVAGGVAYIKEEQFFATAEQATATITDYVPLAGSGVPPRNYCPVFHFKTKAEQNLDYVGKDCPGQPDPSKIGQQEVLYYDPKNSEFTIQERGWAGGEFAGPVVGAIGAVFFSLFWLIPFAIMVVRRLARGRPGRQ